MTKTTTDTQLTRPGRKRRFWGMLLAICAAPCVAFRSYEGLAPWTIPESSILSNAIVQYDCARIISGVRQSHGLDDGDWIGAFDYDSRRFAIEYEVCPRCGAAGDFRAGGGGCECGYSY